MGPGTAPKPASHRTHRITLFRRHCLGKKSKRNQIYYLDIICVRTSYVHIAGVCTALFIAPHGLRSGASRVCLNKVSMYAVWGGAGTALVVAPQIRVTERDASKVSLPRQHPFERRVCFQGSREATSRVARSNRSRPLNASWARLSRLRSRAAASNGASVRKPAGRRTVRRRLERLA